MPNLRGTVLKKLSGRGINRFLRSRASIEIVRFCDLYKDLLGLVGKNASVILDVGANVGQSAEIYSRMFPVATIYSVEPFQRSFQQLLDKRIPRVKPINAALASQPGQAMLHVNADSRANSLLAASAQGRRLFPAKLVEVEQLPVHLMTLDELQKSEGLATVDLLKIDTQGSELEILAGGHRLLPNVRVIQVESNFIPQYRNSSTFSEVDLHLREAGFFLHNIYNIYQDPATCRRIYGLGVFLNRKHFRPDD